MKIAEVGLFDECFTHIGEDGHQTTWASSRLFAFCEANPDVVDRVMVMVDAQHAEFCVTNRGVEMDRLVELLQKPDSLKKPILFVYNAEDNSHLLVDGTHRYVCYFALKLEKIPAYIVTYEVAKAFIIEDAPQTSAEQVMAPSHLTTLRKLGLS